MLTSSQKAVKLGWFENCYSHSLFGDRGEAIVTDILCQTDLVIGL